MIPFPNQTSNLTCKALWILWCFIPLLPTVPAYQHLACVLIYIPVFIMFNISYRATHKPMFVLFAIYLLYCGVGDIMQFITHLDPHSPVEIFNHLAVITKSIFFCVIAVFYNTTQKDTKGET